MTTVPQPSLMSDLQEAAGRGEVQVHYLPIVGLADGRVIGVEALARWCPAGQVLEAEVFLEMAEKTGAIMPIGRHVVETACARVAAWNTDHADRPLRLAVNLSLQQLTAPDSVDHLAGVLTATGLAPEQLCLEMGEDALGELGEALSPTLEALEALGVRLSVDDVGTGASSLVALQRHRVHELKIDRSFVERMDLDEQAAALVRGVASLASALGLDLVAEGVERPAQEQMLRSLRCLAAQGWLYSRPDPDLDAAVHAAGAAAARSLSRRVPSHEELWEGIATPGAAARFVEAVFEATPIGMILVDASGRHVGVNPAAAAILGRAAEELLGRACWEDIHPADLHADLAGTDRVLAGECTSYRVEERILAADGSEQWVEVTVVGIPGDNRARGEAPRLLRQVRSIAGERSAAKDAALLRSVIEASPDALVIADVTGRCTQWNQAAQSLFGWSSTEMVGAGLTRLVTADAQMALARVVGDAVQGRAVRWDDATWVASDGSPREVDVTLGPVRDGEGTVVGVVALARDVATQRAADRALREAHAALASHANDLSEVNERLEAFASALTHDLLQPVAAVDGFLGLLQAHAHELTEDHRDWLDRAARGKERIADAIRALHRAATEDELELAPLAPAPLIDEVARDLGLPADALDSSGAAALLVRADRGLLTRVIANLLQNSQRYRHPDRPLRVEVGCRPAEPGSTQDGGPSCATVVLTDNGRGMAEDELEPVFERGVRGRAAGATLGTGTGLATVRSLVERMGGEVWAEPHPDGARICLRLRTAGPSVG